VTASRSGAALSPRASGPFTPAAARPGDYPEVPAILTAGFSLYILVWFLEFGERVPLLGLLRFEFILGAALAIAAVASIMARVESNKSRLTKFICLYFLFLVLHLPLSQYFAVSWDAFVNWILKFSCMALFTYAFVRNPRTLRIFMATLLLVFFKLGSEAFLGKITGTMVWENQGIMRLYGTLGTRFGHPNSLSGFGVCMLPFLYYLFPVVQRKWRIVVVLLFVFSINIIVFTGSRTGYLTTIALALFLWMRSAKKGRFIAVTLVVAVVGLPLVPPQYESRFMSAFVGQEAEGHSKEARIELADDGWRMFMAHPEGIGIYAFRYARAEQMGKESYDPHNLYLQALVDLGVVGSAIFALLVVGLWRELWSTEAALAETERQLRSVPAKLSSEGALRHLADVRFMRATASAFLAYLFTRLVLGIFGHDLYEIYWWLASGASIAIVNMRPIVDARTAEIARAVTAPATAAITWWSHGAHAHRAEPGSRPDELSGVPQSVLPWGASR
jgi:O-antigen ligase